MDEQALLAQTRVRLLEPCELPECHRLLDKHHYLKRIHPVGQRLYYVATDAQDQWLGLLVFSAPAKHLKHRDRWIGWSARQRDRRLPLVANNSRFLLLPKRTVPNLGTRVLRLALDRLSADWQAQYGHPVLVVETFVDPQQFCGTVYTANGWEELGTTDGWGRHARDYYVKHDRPKRLFVRELVKNARRSLQAQHLKPSLAMVEQRSVPRCDQPVTRIRALTEHFKQVPEFRARCESYPVWSLLTLILLAILCDSPRGQKDLAKFARRLTQAQRRALGIRRNPKGFYPAPSQSTFCRLLQGVDGAKLNAVIQAIQQQLRGDPPAAELIVLDGKEPKHGPGDSVLTAVCVPSQYYLGSALVDQKTNEIPIARELFGQVDLQGRWVSLDALHTQTETARSLVLDHGADYLLTVKANQPTLRQNIDAKLEPPPGGFSPSEANGAVGPQGRVEQDPTGVAHPLQQGHPARGHRVPLCRPDRSDPPPGQTQEQ
ncbi:MAG: ISAs1 family transposase [Rhodobacteraceae bacterium]|nr:ISAs1 family transposase [Paracoccaceae bacterium]